VVGVKSQTATNLRLAKWRYAPATAIPADEELYQRQIKATDRQIDAVAYELYRLTEEKVRVVEEGKELYRKGLAGLLEGGH
jgi:hypothetical protein